MSALGGAALVALVGGGVIWGYVHNREQAEREGEGERPVAAPAQVLHRSGRTFVVLDSAARRRGGVALAAASPARHPPWVPAYGRVLDTDSITAAMDRYASADASAGQAAARLAQTRAEYRRVSLLRADSQSVSLSHLEQARAAYQVDSAADAAASRALRSAASVLREDFGPVIDGWLKGGSPVLDSVLSGRRSLLQVTLPPPLELDSPPDSTFAVLPSGDTVSARFVSWASRTDPDIQGQSFFCLATSRPGLLPGASAQVQVRPKDGVSGGAVLPQDAVVWYDGAPWVYVQGERGELSRRPVTIGGRAPGTYVVEGVAPGATVVVRGAALVLSAELRSSTPVDEDP